MKVGLRGLHPVSAFVFFLSSIALTLLTQYPLLIFIGFFGAALLDIRGRKMKSVKMLLSFILPLVLLVTLFNVLFAHYGVTVLFTFKSGNNLTLESLICGAVYGVRTACLILWLFCFNEIVDEDKFIYLFSRFTPRLALVISMALRFIPLFSQRAEQIEKSRRAIGVTSKSGSFFNRLSAGVHNLSILISWSLERAIDTADSMTSRGYGLKKRKNCVRYPFRLFDFVLIFFSAISLILAVVFRSSVYADYNPVIYVEPFSLRSLSVCVLFFVLCVLPIIFDVTEERAWSISN